jgi:hypothetical protein
LKPTKWFNSKRGKLFLNTAWSAARRRTGSSPSSKGGAASTGANSIRARDWASPTGAQEAAGAEAECRTGKLGGNQGLAVDSLTGCRKRPAEVERFLQGTQRLDPQESSSCELRLWCAGGRAGGLFRFAALGGWRGRGFFFGRIRTGGLAFLAFGAGAAFPIIGDVPAGAFELNGG